MVGAAECAERFRIIFVIILTKLIILIIIMIIIIRRTFRSRACQVIGIRPS